MSDIETDCVTDEGWKERLEEKHSSPVLQDLAEAIVSCPEHLRGSFDFAFACGVCLGRAFAPSYYDERTPFQGIRMESWLSREHLERIQSMVQIARGGEQ